MKREPVSAKGCHENGAAFTLVELLVVIATVVMLAAMLLPAMAGTKSDSRAFQCLDNQRRLVTAWSMYAKDNNDRLAINSDPHVNPSPGSSPSWVSGIVDWTTGAYNTNKFYLIDDRHSLLGSYLNRSAAIFHCPADIFLSPAQRARGWANRARSVAMNAAIGDGYKYQEPGNPFGWPVWYVAKKMSELNLPGPDQSWVLIDEHPDSIDDGLIYICSAFTNGAAQFTELPACYHNGAAGVSFADGHAVLHRWHGPAVIRAVQYVTVSRVPVFNDTDLAWLAQRTPRQN